MPCSVVSCVNSYSNVLQGGTVSGGGGGAENDIVLVDYDDNDKIVIVKYIQGNIISNEAPWNNTTNNMRKYIAMSQLWNEIEFMTKIGWLRSGLCANTVRKIY